MWPIKCPISDQLDYTLSYYCKRVPKIVPFAINEKHGPSGDGGGGAERVDCPNNSSNVVCCLLQRDRVEVIDLVLAGPI